MDITESTLQQVATNIGVQKSVRNLNQVEKRLLRIISLTDQMKNMNAFGDYAKTINKYSGIILKKIMKNFVNVCKNGVRTAFSFKQEMAY